MTFKLNGEITAVTNADFLLRFSSYLIVIYIADNKNKKKEREKKCKNQCSLSSGLFSTNPLSLVALCSSVLTNRPGLSRFGPEQIVCSGFPHISCLLRQKTSPREQRQSTQTVNNQ